ncbi:MAG: PIN domain-containing protein [Prevotella sp.]|uniref:type II toxin-antitoxin system VapC family toxin n=1 Tax=Leyella stercorea TaxID=363265 RepID=UPI001F39F8C0|nr:MULTISPECIES: PIN domain-containing protein [Prevotellaceae]MCF2577592.1 PIN domain-containing protein [Leyella stercorea]MCI7184587.1 PIN domain-containing protein [Prevotella sp.]
MKKVFLDTNIVADLFLKREPFCQNSLKLFTLGFHKKITLYVSSLSYATLAYLCRKMKKEERVLLFEKLRSLTVTTTVDRQTVDMALVSGFDDLEDAMQYYSAISSKVDVVLTRNKKDFVEANVPVMTPDEFFING